jgi:glycosyltransferase involved in cell wall biosynthesis
MNILVLVYNTFRNDARVEKAIAAYREAGHEVRTIALEDPAAGAARDVIRVNPRGALLAWRVARAVFAALPFWLRAPTRPLSLVRFTDRVASYRAFARRAVRALDRSEFKPDLVHANDFNTLFAAELLHDRRGVPFVYDAHELWTERNFGAALIHPSEMPWELAQERRLARKALRVITVSDSIGRHMAEALDVAPPVIVRNVPYALDGEHPARGLRAKLGLPPGARLLVYTGKATYNRGLEETLEALAGLPDDFHLLLLGDFEPRFKPILEAAIARHALRARVHHHGPVPSDEVPSWAAEGDLCLVPIRGACLSYEYCLPNKLFEGIQAGLPILATNLVEMRQTLESYGCGLTYESGNVGDLRDKILQVLTAPGVAERLRRNAAAAARSLNWETEKQRLLSVLEAA